MDEQRAGEPEFGSALASGAPVEGPPPEDGPAASAAAASEAALEAGTAEEDRADPAPERRARDTSAPAAVRELADRIEARLAELDNRPVSAHGEVYASIHAELSQVLERLDV